MADASLMDRFRNYLREHKLPVTGQRLAIANLLLAANQHLSADDVAAALEQEGHSAGLATVYRTLDLLVLSGVVRLHDFGEGFRRYEPMAGPADHEHLVCLRCGAVEEFSNDRLARMLPVLADEHHFQHQRHRVEIFGLCHACQQRDLKGLR